VSTLPVKIRLPEAGHGAVIEIDGQDVSSYVRAIGIESAVGDVTKLRLDFVKVDLDIEGPVDVTALGDWYKTYRIGKAVRDGLAEAQRETS